MIEATPQSAQHTVWWYASTTPDGYWAEVFAAVRRAQAGTQAELIRAIYGEDVPPATLLVSFGKPMIVLPLFWDQVDNAQRVDETGFGKRLSTYGFKTRELTGAIERLLGDRALAERLAAMSARIKSTSGTVRAAELIERLAATREPVAA